MNENPSDELTYRFAAFGARGRITLKTDLVHVRTRSYLGWWEQTTPLEHLSPNYAMLFARPPVYIWAWIIAVSFVLWGICGVIWGATLYPQKLLCAGLMLFGVYFMLHLYRHRKTEWIIFFTTQTGHGVNYTRQGPDEVKCDDFTRRMVEHINASRNAKESRTR